MSGDPWSLPQILDETPSGVLIKARQGYPRLCRSSVPHSHRLCMRLKSRAASHAEVSTGTPPVRSVPRGLPLHCTRRILYGVLSPPMSCMCRHVHPIEDPVR